MIKFFSGNQSIVLILIPLFVIVHLLLDVYFPIVDYTNFEQENLWGINFYAIPPVLTKILAFILVSLNAILINFVFNSLEFYDRNTFLPSIIYVLIVSLFPSSIYFSEDLIGHFFFILTFFQILNIQQNDDARSLGFFSGLLLGIAFTFIPLYGAFLLVALIVLFSIRPFMIREHLLVYFGFSIPVVWLFFVNSNWINQLFEFNGTKDFFDLNDYIMIALGVALLSLILMGIRGMLSRSKKSSVKFKRLVRVSTFSFFYFFTAGIFLSIFHHTFSYFIVGSIVLPFIIPYAFLNLKHSWVSNFFFYLLVAVNVIKFFFI
ncbi:MAG TPA: hypothetical protein VL021_04690 [Brumimicrobium sp.]|nr:hypothetical protein [Brumimicrobium sp.]